MRDEDKKWPPRLMWLPLLSIIMTLLSSSNAMPTDWLPPPQEAATDETLSVRRARHELLLHAMTDWLRANDGILSDKVHIRPVDPFVVSRLGMFAKADISQFETILNIPAHLVINAGELIDEPTPMECKTVRKLIAEIDKGTNSFFFPYVNFILNTASPRQIPSAWSTAGQERLLELIGTFQGDHILPPRDLLTWLTDDWYGRCSPDKEEDPLQEFAAVFSVTHGWDDLLIPFFDILNHRNNGESGGHNVESHFVAYGQPVTVIAKRDISAGEELYNSYNECETCGGRTDWYGTFELFRDYGFVEPLPQRWIFGQDLGFLLTKKNEYELQVEWTHGEPEEGHLVFLDNQMTRLLDLGDMDYDEDDEKTTTIPKDEWKVLEEFREAIITAIAAALKQEWGGEQLKDCTGNAVKPKRCAIQATARYDPLGWEPDDLDYAEQTCEAPWDHAERGYDFIEMISSPYQQQDYFINAESQDTCLNIEGTTQICASYRPHYHELGVHYPARFLPPGSIKRVAFIGGGDSMLLHEVLKYPSLEKVIGLELDQKVPRASFKYFGVQPHFEHPKVEWWFGDATKTLLMLPKDYFGSFDLVLVDLSETVMSFKVTKELDIMEALALLVKPEGIMLKNELYLQSMSNLFKYTLQIHVYDVSVICSQSMIFSSNSVDFLHAQQYNQGIDDMLFLNPIITAENATNLEFFHDYNHNTSHSHQSHCQWTTTPPEPPTVQTNNPGILMIVDSSETTLSNIESVKTTLVETIDNKLPELTVVAATANLPKHNRGLVVIVLKQGYVVARTWPEHHYCALDIFLWSAFGQQDALRLALVTALGSHDPNAEYDYGVNIQTQSYRIVTGGGMLGVATWKEDAMNRGPQYLSSADCPKASDDTPTERRAEEEEEETATVDMTMTHDERIRTILQEGFSSFLAATIANLTVGAELAQTTLNIVVMCGRQDKHCAMYDRLDKMRKQQEMFGTVKVKLIAFSMCAFLQRTKDGGGTEYEATSDVLYTCERTKWKDLVEKLRGRRKIHALIVDPAALIGNAKLLLRMIQLHRDRLLARSMVVMAFNSNANAEWLSNWMERLRKDVYAFDPAHRAMISFNATTDNFISLELFQHDENFVSHVKKFTAQVASKSDLIDYDISSIRAGLWRQQGSDWLQSETTRIYKPTDYNQRAPLWQWQLQEPLDCMQSMVQLETKQEEDALLLSTDTLRGGLADTFVSITKPETKVDVFEYDSSKLQANGCIIVAICPSGHVILTWDGSRHVHLNVFQFSEKEKVQKAIVRLFIQHTGNVLEQKLLDIMPRGHGLVVNFAYDIEPSREQPFWTRYDPSQFGERNQFTYEEPEEGDDDDEYGDEEERPKSYRPLVSHQQGWEDDDAVQDWEDDEDDELPTRQDSSFSGMETEL